MFLKLVKNPTISIVGVCQNICYKYTKIFLKLLKIITKKLSFHKIIEMNKPRLILGLDVSTACIGVSIVLDEGNRTQPQVILLTHVSPKAPKDITGFEALIIKKDAFENLTLILFSQTLYHAQIWIQKYKLLPLVFSFQKGILCGRRPVW